MKRFIALIALAGVVGSASAAVIRESANIKYTPKPTFTLVKSPDLPPGYEFRLMEDERITWINEFTAPCRVAFPLGTTKYSVECDKEEYFLEIKTGGGKQTVRIKPRK